LAVLSGATAAALRGVEPFATWFYVFAWYATLLVLEGASAALSDGRLGLLERPTHLATLLAWSAVTWLFFELLNLRLQNWYYVFVPREAFARRIGVLCAFATVFPAIFCAERLLDRLGLARRTGWPRLRVTPRFLSGLPVAGVLALVLSLVWPDVFFPLVWVALTLLLEPFNYRRDPGRSLLGDLERGQPGRLLRLLAAGATVGLLWELYNVRARSKWIYTVPGFESWKLFEMPVAGFLGFPPFALECFAVWQALVLAGLAVPRVGPPGRARASIRMLAAGAALALSVTAFAGMERSTVSSYEPRLSDLPGVPASQLQKAGFDVFTLAAAKASEVAGALQPPEIGPAGEVGAPLRGSAAEAEGWIEQTRLVVLRGIGTENARRLRAAGISSVADLATAGEEPLLERLASDGGAQVPPRRVRVWVRAAREHMRGAEARP
jgi:hypothetical protein